MGSRARCSAMRRSSWRGHRLSIDRGDARGSLARLPEIIAKAREPAADLVRHRLQLLAIGAECAAHRLAGVVRGKRAKQTSQVAPVPVLLELDQERRHVPAHVKEELLLELW